MFSGTEGVREHLPFRIRVLLDAFLLTRGPLRPADDVARCTGFRNRFEANRALKREGLPSFQRVEQWMRVLAWVDRWERTGQSLSGQTLSVGLDPSAGYRLIKRLTGMHWSEVIRRGSEWIVSRFLSEESRIRKVRALPRRADRRGLLATPNRSVPAAT